MADLKISYEELQHKYAEFAPIYRQKTWFIEQILGVQRLRKRLIQQANGRVLDVACGTGENFRYMPSSATLTAVDLSPEMLEQAQHEAHNLNMNISFAQMKAEALQFPANSFDTVISTMSTCTFNDPILALQEMRRVCVPHGQILLIEHGRSRWGWVAGYQDRNAHHHFAGTGCRWNQNPLALVNEAGLKITHSRQHFLGIFHAIEIKLGHSGVS